MRVAPLVLLLALSAPLAAATPDPMAIHARVVPFDAHIDIGDDFDSAAAPATADGATQFDLPKAKRGGLKGAGIAVFVHQAAESPAQLSNAQAEAEARHRIIAGLATRYPAQVGIAHSPAEFRALTAAGKFAIVETVVNGGAFVDRVDALDAWAGKGVAIFGFVHAGHNRLADSSRPALVRGETASGRSGGLSPLGKAAVTRLNRLGVLIDVSQLSDAAFDQTLALSTAPVIATHSDVRALVDTPRNLSDAQLDRLRANGGVIAINAFSAYLRPRDPAFAARLEALAAEYGIAGGTPAQLTPDKAKEYDVRYHALRATEPKANLDDLVRAIDHVVKRIGIDHVALSSDFNHGGGVIGWDNVGEAGNVTAALVRHGYGEADIAKLWSGNVLRIWARAQSLRAGGSARR